MSFCKVGLASRTRLVNVKDGREEGKGKSMPNPKCSQGERAWGAGAQRAMKQACSQGLLYSIEPVPTSRAATHAM